MNNDWIAEALKELMDKFDIHRAEWIAKHGSDKGFNEWFTDAINMRLLEPQEPEGPDFPPAYRDFDEQAIHEEYEEWRKFL